MCDVYMIDKKEDLDLIKIKKKGVVIIGLGNIKKVYFVDYG